MRTTVNIDDELLAAAKVLAVRTHRTIGSVMEDALRKLLADEDRRDHADFVLPDFSYASPGLRPGVDLADRERMAELLEDNRLGRGGERA